MDENKNILFKEELYMKLKRTLKKMGSAISGAAIGTVMPIITTAEVLGFAVVAVIATPIEMVNGAIEGGKKGKKMQYMI